MAYRREELRRGKNSLCPAPLPGDYTTRRPLQSHRPYNCATPRETAMGFIFLSMEDETGIANVIVTRNPTQRLASCMAGSS
jgi:hypothetical protein